ncbi:MAG: CHAT domain-containing protein [Terracidiphilus sp.]
MSNDDQNPKRPSDPSEEALLRALEELMATGSSRASGPRWDPSREPLSGSCPESDEWLPLLGGDDAPADAAKREVLLAHAAQCGKCATYLKMLTAEATEEEVVELSKLAPATRNWQHKLAVELARTSRHGFRQPVRLRPSRLYLWSSLGLAASITIAAVTFFWWQRANSPERLLAEAYTQSRTFDLRMPGAGFAEVTPETHLRGGGAIHESSRLLDARAHIERQLENAPEDPHWLQLEARADIQEEKFDPAIDILDRLLATERVSADLLVDDATAYFERGSFTGSENDRATALERLSRADVLAPGDTLVLFNEAVVLEDRGQLMNAVETWNRYLRFERDPRWLAEGRTRLQTLEQKLNQLKTHQSRMDQRLGTSRAMLKLAGDSGALAAIDEELSSSLLPRLLISAYPLPVDCSRGSPCATACNESCQASRTLLYSLAASLERNHQDPWLTQLLPPESSPSEINPGFNQAAQALANAVNADGQGDYLTAQQQAVKAGGLFHALGNAAGEDRADVEQSYAQMRLSNIPGCYSAAHPLLGRHPQYAWIQIQDLMQDGLCDASPGTAAESDPILLRAVNLAQDRHYALLELRARNVLGSAAVDARDSESAWRDYLATVRKFYSGDYPAMRLYGSLSGLQEVERDTPRARLALLLQREVVGVIQLTPSRELIPTERLNLAAAAIRTGSAAEAQEQMQLAKSELAANGGGKSVEGFLSETEVSMARMYLDHRDLTATEQMLDAANDHMAGEHNSYHRREYAAVLGSLKLAEGHPELAELILRDAVLEEERLGGTGGADSIVLAQKDRELYAVLAGVWLAHGHTAEQVLSLWERYRLRILGEPPPVCPNKGLDCLKPRLSESLARMGNDQLLGQIVLLDRLLLYKATAQGVVWKQVPVGMNDLLAATAVLELGVTSPATPNNSVDLAARKTGDILLSQLTQPAAPNGPNETSNANWVLLLEPDPLLGNLPWPSVATPTGPIGMEFNLEESPSLLLDPRPASGGSSPVGKPLVVGASVASGESQLLPEVLNEARAVARFGDGPSVLLANQATETQVVAQLTTASTIHFAGHAAQQEGGTRLLLASAKPVLQENSKGANFRRASMKEPSPRDIALDKPYLDSALFRKHPPRAARLVVFSACSTGKKEEGWNHGMNDIVGTLAALGVPDVVATRWQIDSGSAVPMMDAFYGGLAQGLTVPQALTSARQALIRDPRYRHPYYWAAYYASGSGRSDLKPYFHAGK